MLLVLGVFCDNRLVEHLCSILCWGQSCDAFALVYFQTTVISVRKCQDFSTTGQWIVITESNGKQVSATFDAVMVCIGHHIESYVPLQSFPGKSLVYKAV